MCVIIFVPQGQTISKHELLSAWNVNSDGAGYAERQPKGIVYHRGFMDFNKFYNEIKYKIGRNDLLLHFRISTSSKVNELQTHPYEIGRKERLKGVTKGFLTCMNGVITGQACYDNYNDTMSYISDHLEAFKILGETESQDLLNLIESDTGSRWALMTQNKVLVSSDFQKYKGLYYSNLNHIVTTGKTTYKTCYITKGEHPKDILIPKVWKKVKKQPELVDDLKYLLKHDPFLKHSLYWCDTVEEVKDMIYY